jgi:hypothetical protein
VELAVSDVVRSASTLDPTVPGKLLRMVFHDCFVEVCTERLLTHIELVHIYASGIREMCACDHGLNEFLSIPSNGGTRVCTFGSVLILIQFQCFTCPCARSRLRSGWSSGKLSCRLP